MWFMWNKTKISSYTYKQFSRHIFYTRIDALFLIWYFSFYRWVCLCRLKGAIQLDHRVGRHRARPGTGSLLLEIPVHRQTHCLCLRTLPNRTRPLKRKWRPLISIHAYLVGVVVVDALGKNIHFHIIFQTIVIINSRCGVKIK